MSILLVTKPMAPPWHDSSSQLARAFAVGLQGLEKPLHLRLMSTQHGSDISGVEDEVIYKGAGRFAPGILQNLRVFKRLLTAKGEELRHFFFAPNPRSAAAARVAKRLIDRPSVHTLCSMPAQGRAVKPSLFADRHLVLSESARIRLEREGVESHLVEPAVLPLSFSEVGRERCRERFGDYVLFAGDLRPGGGALEALSALSHLPSTFKLVIATRPKGADYERCLRQLERRVEELNLKQRVYLLGRIDWIGDLVAGAHVQILPATDLTAKMDYPLVLLEGLAAGVPAVVAQESPFAVCSDERSVFACPSKDAQALARACEAAISDEAATLAKDVYASRFRPERLAQDMVRHYEEMGVAV